MPERSSDWLPYSERVSSLTNNKIFIEEDNHDNDVRNKDKGFYFCSPCIKGFIIGSLLAGVALAAFITLKTTSTSSQASKQTVEFIVTTTTVVTSSTAITSASSTSTTTSFDSCSGLRWNQTGVLYPGISDNPFPSPLGFGIDSNDTLYISDHGSRCVEAWFKGAVNGTRVTDTNDNHADYIAFDKNGYFYINNHITDTVRRYSLQSTNGVTVAGSGTSSNALNSFNYPLGIDIDDNSNIYVADRDNKRVMKWAPNATNGTIFIDMTLSNITTMPSSLRLSKDSSNQIYSSDGSYHRVYVWSFASVYPDVILNQVRNSTNLNTPKDLMFDPYKNLYVAENSASGRVIRYCPNSTMGEIVIEGSGTTAAGKVGIAFDSNLNLFALLRNGTVMKYALL